MAEELKIRCSRCKCFKNKKEFFYKGKEHKTCYNCSWSKKVIAKNKCQECGIQAYYNLAGKTIGIRCGKHRLPGMINVKIKRCIVCKKKHPNFNLEGESKATHCGDCALPGMIDVKNKKCVVCKKKQPSFNLEGEPKATHCGDCASPKMINVKDKKCVVCKKKQPSFNLEGEPKATHCGDCALPGMIDVKNKKCVVCKKKQPSFNLEGEPKATHCGDCALPEMINVISKKCIVCMKKIPNFNYEGETKATHCGDCALPEMIDVKNNKCIVCKKKRPNFNLEGETKATHCGDCALPEMIDVISKKCIVCKKKQPNFNLEGETKATHCGDCALPETIDVKNNKCNQCSTRAYFGFPLSQPNRCSRHKEEGMIKYPRAGCKADDCKERARFGVKEPIHCEDHKTLEDIDLVERTCLQCGRLDIVNKDQICINFCLANDKFYSIYQKRTKDKEERIVNILKAEFGPATSLDKTIQTACSLARPDIVYETPTHTVIVEVDEFGHEKQGYCPAGEHARMVTIFNSFGGKPVIFIRYNPDDHKSNQKIPRNKKEDTLLRWVRKALLPPLNPCQVIYLFYSNYQETQSEFLELDPYDIYKYTCLECEEDFYLKELFTQHAKQHLRRKITTKKLSKVVELSILSN